MEEYNLTFHELEEGKKYLSTATSNEYEMREGFLFNLKTDDFSYLSQITLKKARFKEIPIEIPKGVISLLGLIDSSYKWLVKDADGDIWLAASKPTRIEGQDWWSFGNIECILLNEVLEYMIIDFDWMDWKTPIFIDGAID